MPRPAFCVVAFALGISGFVGALASVILGTTFASQGQPVPWLNYVVVASLAEAALATEFGRRAGAVGHPHAALRKIASGFALATLLLIAGATLARVA